MKIKNYAFVLLALLLTFAACEGPAGPKGEQGPAGPEGAIGPAGDNGSIIYAGTGAPTGDIGTTGDYYLNQTTGGLYGPKDAEGWGEPIIVLMGEDGQDGTDGDDGQDGEDGSQIYAGAGAPAGSLGKAGDFYLDKSTYKLYGPKTSAGWGTPINLKGADGNANVTRYMFGGEVFSVDGFAPRYISSIDTKAEMLNSAWIVYLVHGYDDPEPQMYQVPGYGRSDDFYSLRIRFEPDNTRPEGVVFDIRLEEGAALTYGDIMVVRIKASNAASSMIRGNHSIIPEDLDVSNYNAVAEYYGFSREN